eukprot:Plantae.Rhodophyta-Purpureofilum_apyrenoidigerum.ctg12187.p1 GENE.Plantae.Rhodophyta-Purpureofilum_apyrenoidigerum.ctg12187~~Plantae.Rhodophyta-Purpureofilum_apyrenoidigerum.ctg12187.p1  ORF type:complete len:568 (+),score=96.92 Plantae.Rhodophyta-Purpureofilum_apyrenoidigerum.ctg12187:25-1704(+)
MARDGASTAFLEPIARSAPMPIPSSKNSSSVCASSAGSSMWGSASSVPFIPGSASSSVQNQMTLEQRMLSAHRREVMALTQVEEDTERFTFSGYSPASVSFLATPQRFQVEDESEDEDDTVQEPPLSKYMMSPLTSVETITSTSSFSVSQTLSSKPSAMGTNRSSPFPEVDAALRQLDTKLSYLNVSARYKTRKVLTMVLESCRSPAEVEMCIEVTSILTELEMDELTLQAGALSVLKSFRQRAISGTVEAEAFSILDAHGKLHESIIKTQSTGELSDNQTTDILDRLSDTRLIALELARAVVSWRNFAKGSQASLQLSSKDFADLTLRFYAPLAHSCGYALLQRELEENAFATKHPQEYYDLKQKVHARTSQFVEVLDASRRRLESILWNDATLRGKVSCVRVSGRQKSLYSIFRKMQKKNLQLDEVYDMLALRVVVTPRARYHRCLHKQEEEACYRALEVVHSEWVEHGLQRTKDYIASPKPNGYRSLHTTVSVDSKNEPVPLEIQIRSDNMHRVAEIGSAAHIQYKAEGLKALQSYANPLLRINCLSCRPSRSAQI